MGIARQSKQPPDTSRYRILQRLASGGMATVYVGALRGQFEVAPLVAIKRLHDHLHDDPSTRSALIHEARLAARIRHANVVDVREIEIIDGALQLIMSYVEGGTLSELLTACSKSQLTLPAPIAIRIALDACAGLHAAHELLDENGKRIELVHRDISPQNLLVGVDGITRVTDFGIAKTDTITRTRTATGLLKGKFSYMAPEYVHGHHTDRRLDVFALGVILWESLAQRRLFKGNSEAETFAKLINMEAPRISDTVRALPNVLNDIVAKAVEKDPEKRFATAEAFAIALESAAKPIGLVASYLEVAQFVRQALGSQLEETAQAIRESLGSITTGQERNITAISALPKQHTSKDATTALAHRPPKHRPEPSPTENTRDLTPITIVHRPSFAANENESKGHVSSTLDDALSGGFYTPARPDADKLNASNPPLPWHEFVDGAEEHESTEQHSEQAISSGDRATPLLVRPIKDKKPAPPPPAEKRYGPLGTAIMLKPQPSQDVPPCAPTQQSPGTATLHSMPADACESPRDQGRRAFGKVALHLDGMRPASQPEISSIPSTPQSRKAARHWHWLVLAAVCAGIVVGGALWKAKKTLYPSHEIAPSSFPESSVIGGTK